MGECGPSICRLKLAFSKILKYEKLSLSIRLMMALGQNHSV